MYERRWLWRVAMTAFSAGGASPSQCAFSFLFLFVAWFSDQKERAPCGGCVSMIGRDGKGEMRDYQHKRNGTKGGRQLVGEAGDKTMDDDNEAAVRKSAVDICKADLANNEVIGAKSFVLARQCLLFAGNGLLGVNSQSGR
ncbi:hypothetical protein BDP55DRAFT_739204 [Colletotrichum godetiae]|uniref:Uncharacterized protein n=1 Tax=Colletotrichum godetiae TaxID=1209918 RepID=A0AAJ0EMN1_9PEZI|nr:uncharacterized protein BDP55DRAFT_739204 [Colletotrichum godetiae]KAK1656747.1 hypothetical protein BDP55DRAFT_739204 [Colletotrichum godetiae]